MGFKNENHPLGLVNLTISFDLVNVEGPSNLFIELNNHLVNVAASFIFNFLILNSNSI